MTKLPLFDSILIQTNARCNLRCKFCFFGQYQDYETDDVLATDVIENLLDQLAGLRYSGRVGLYNMNDPTTDPRLVALLASAKRRLPDAFHFLSTNGLSLTQELLDQITEHVSLLRIDNYGKLPPLDYSSPRIEIQDRCGFYRVAASNRGGALRGLPAASAPGRGPCANPFGQLVIAPPGIAVLCCSDGFANAVVGDARKTPLIEIWRGEALTAVRRALANGRRTEMQICKTCSVEGGGFREYFEDPERYREIIGSFVDAVHTEGAD